MPLPPLYARWTEDLLGALPPAEPRAQCDDCVMCEKPSGEVPTSAFLFDETIKCCVYMPRLRNFTVGAILADGELPAMASVHRRVDDPCCATPLGLSRPATYELVYRNTVNAIGTARSLRCPHFIESDASCGIWTHRDALCATWFCQHERGRRGQRFWLAVQAWLAVIEHRVSQWCALELGISPGGVLANIEGEDTVESARVEGQVSRSERASWGRWWDKKPEYYRRCHELVEHLNLADVHRIGGVEVLAHAQAARRAHEALSDPIPKRLRVGAFRTLGARRDGGLRVVTHSSLNALDLPSRLVALLPVFNGGRVDETLAELETSYQTQLDAEFLGTLVDWGVLVEALEPQG